MLFNRFTVGFMIMAGVHPAMAQVDFTRVDIEQISTEAQLRSGAGATGTALMNGVAVEQTPNGRVFAIHVDASQQESFLQVDPATGAATKITDVPAIAAGLGSPYSSNFTLVGGFVFSPITNSLYFSENFNGDLDEVSVIGVNVNTGVANLVVRNTTIDGLNDFSILPSGDLVGVLGEDGNRTVGTLHTNTGTWTERLTEGDLLAAAPGTSELPPESIGASFGTGEVFIFCHDDLKLFNTSDITAATPVLNLLTQPVFDHADLHDVVADEQGNMYAYDEHDERIIVVRKSDSAVFTVPFDDITDAIGGTAPFAPSLWRGLAARTRPDNQTDLYLSSFSNAYGIVRVRFGAPNSSVQEWTLY